MSADLKQQALDKSQARILCGVELTKEQSKQIKEQIGVDVSWLLAEQVSRLEARRVSSGSVSITRLTWCW